MPNIPFGKTETQWNELCDSIKDQNGSYQTFFNMQENLGKLRKQNAQYKLIKTMRESRITFGELKTIIAELEQKSEEEIQRILNVYG